MTLNTIEKHRHQIYSCKRCASCIKWSWYDSRLPGFIEGITKKGFDICPVFEFTGGFESDSVRGKMGLAKGILDNRIQIKRNIIEKFYQCTGCWNCTEHCPQYRQEKLDPYEIIRIVRAELLERGYDPPKGIRIESKPRRWKIAKRWIPPEIETKDSRIGYFVGCNTSSRFPHIVQSFLSILERAGEKLTVIREGLCCGNEQFSTGQLDLAKYMADENLSNFSEKGFDELVVTCGRCYQMFKNDYLRIIGKTISVIHSSQVLENLFEKGALKFSKSLDKTITYHDPCELGRKSSVYDAPRTIVSNIPGVTFVEMKENRENSWCCGGGVPLKSAFRGMALKIAERRLEHALDVGAEIIVTTCPVCKQNLSEAAIGKNSKLEVCELTELIQTVI